MYPTRELTRLAADKAALRRAIALQRARCTEAAVRVAQPFELLDRMLLLWRRLSPLALCVGPLGGLVARSVFPRRKILGSLLRWGPLVFSVVRGLSFAVKPRGEPASSANGRH
jgi:hypothetical protein